MTLLLQCTHRVQYTTVHTYTYMYIYYYMYIPHVQAKQAKALQYWLHRENLFLNIVIILFQSRGWQKCIVHCICVYACICIHILVYPSIRYTSVYLSIVMYQFNSINNDVTDIVISVLMQ